MDKLLFWGNWGNNEKNAWSGTMYGLYKELLKYYSVERLDIKTRHPLLVPFRLLEKLHLGKFDRLYMKYYDAIFYHKYKNQKGYKVIQFEEGQSFRWAESYIYQDLSVGFLLEQYDKKSTLVSFCGIENLSKTYLRRRKIAQSEYYKNASGIFTMGKWLADYIIAHEDVSPSKVHAVGGGINVDSEKIDYSEKTGNKILFVGRDFKRKGGDLVLEAFYILKRIKPEAELYIAGPKHNPIPKDKCKEGIFFMGEQNKEQVASLYNKCDVFCMPSRFEAYGLVFAEALTFGLPCIARNMFSMKEMITDGINGYLVESDDIHILAQKMLQALENQMMQQHVRQQRELYIREYSWETVTKRIVEVMEQNEGTT